MTKRDVFELFIKYLEDRLPGNSQRLPYDNVVYKPNPEIGEGKPPQTAVLYRGGLPEIISANSATLFDQGFEPYPNTYLSTNHALVLTRALASYHAHSFNKELSLKEKAESDDEEPKSERLDQDIDLSYKDEWTAEISKLELVESHLTILCDRLQCKNHNPTTVQRLQSLKNDLPTLTQFLQFASTIQEKRVKSVGPIGIGDIWVPKEGEPDMEDTLVIRLRGGSDLESPHMRDAAWSWLTLLTPEMLRERYMELCGVYCDHYNKILSRLRTITDDDELSIFNVLQDLGENFLHAFLTIVHKFSMSGTWYLDRRLHTDEGLADLADIISFLVDNGIVGSIFVI